MNRVHGVLLAAVFALASGAAQAVTYSFDQITNNASPDVSGQLTMDVTNAGVVSGVSYVDFTFYNNVGLSSSITDVYFDDGTLLGIASISDSGSGVAFNQPASPGNLPGGNAVNFNTTAGFSADSDAPVQPNGVNASTEWVTIRFALQSGQTYADTLAALADGSLRVGLHVQGYANGASNSFVNAIPEPGSVGVFSIGLLVAGGLIRRRASKS